MIVNWHYVVPPGLGNVVSSKCRNKQNIEIINCILGD